MIQNHVLHKLFHARCISAALSALLQVPAFVCCSKPFQASDDSTGRQIYIQWTKNPIPEAIDLFFFDTLGAQNLDAYQQIQNLEGESRLYGLSAAGPRILVALSGKAGDTESWTSIRNYGSLSKLTYRLEEENPDAPQLVAQALLPDGASRIASIQLQPMLSQIQISSVSCDFGGRPYAGKLFRNTAIFLSYAGTEYKPLGAGGGHPVSWINPGLLDSLASLALPNPQMVLQEGYGNIGTARTLEQKTFCCYANPDGHYGIPPTRLVLEGELDGQHCYYPIELRDLQPAAVYQLDITLRRMGSPDPDIPTESGAIVVQSKTIPWYAREEYTVTY